MIALNKKWLSGLVAGALMAVSVEVSTHGVELARYQRLLDTLGRNDYKAELLKLMRGQPHDLIGLIRSTKAGPDG